MDEGKKKQTSITDEREADATSKETLEDIEENEKSSVGKQGGGKESGVPSPDGGFDERKETDDAGPM
jgi:hypothetical protein